MVGGRRAPESDPAAADPHLALLVAPATCVRSRPWIGACPRLDLIEIDDHSEGHLALQSW